jgi:hypothetical protein
MPQRAEYEHLTLAEAVRRLAELHSAGRTRHISQDEHDLLLRAADVIARTNPTLAAFS